jgi:ATP-dependent Clp protease adaptor protein ClpS
MATEKPKKPNSPTPPGSVGDPARTPGNSDSVVLERRPAKVGPPQMYQVVMLNDDYTPMEFVVLVLQEFFNKDREADTNHVENSLGWQRPVWCFLA